MPTNTGIESKYKYDEQLAQAIEYSNLSDIDKENLEIAVKAWKDVATKRLTPSEREEAELQLRIMQATDPRIDNIENRRVQLKRELHLNNERVKAYESKFPQGQSVEEFVAEAGSHLDVLYPGKGAEIAQRMIGQANFGQDNVPSEKLEKFQQDAYYRRKYGNHDA